MYKRNARTTGLRYADALEEAICYGWIDGQMKSVDCDRFRQRWTPRRPGSIWSQTNRARALKLIAQGRMARPGMAAIRAARKSGAWQNAYPNVAPVKIPRDLALALSADRVAQENFRRFAPSARRMFTGWVLDARQAATRERRIAAVVRRSRENRKPGIDSPYT